MCTCENKSAPCAVLTRANEILERAKRAHSQNEFTRAFDLYGRAISMLSVEWNNHHSAEIGKRLVFALQEGSYPAFRKFYGRSTPNREEWGTGASERSKRAADLQIDLLGRGILSSEAEVFQVILHLQRVSGELTNQNRFDEALRYISKTYDTWGRFGGGKPLDERLLGVLKYSEARCFTHLGAYAHALDGVNEAIRLGSFALDLDESARQLRAEIVAKVPGCDPSRAH